MFIIFFQTMMNDSQCPDYLDILNSLLASRKEWEQSSEIVNLSVKAIAHLLEHYHELFQQHKTLINEQSLKLKEFQLQLEGKVSKKSLKEEVVSILNCGAGRQDDSVSEYQKLIKESLSQKERNVPPTIEELKTIAEIVSEKHIVSLKKDIISQLIQQRNQVEDRITTLKEEIKDRMMDIEKDRRQLATECRQAHSRIEESQIRFTSIQNEEKLGELEQSHKRTGETLNNLVVRLQQGYLTKQEVNLLLDQFRDRKSPQRTRPKESERQKPGTEVDLSKEIERALVKFRNEERSSWNEFKHGVTKELGKMVSSETVNYLLSTFQKDMLDKQQLFTNTVSLLEKKVLALSKGVEDHHPVLVKSEKRPEKRSSPSKSVEVIQSSLTRLEKTILLKQSEEMKRVEKGMEIKIEDFDRKLAKELDRRQRHLCEVIEETYNQHLSSNQRETDKEMRVALQRLAERNLYCRYLYIGSRDCKKDSCIPWQKEALNNLVQNYLWKKDSSTIMVTSPGLYRLEVALFGDVTSETIVLLNGDPLADIPKPSNSRSTGVKARGAAFNEVVLVPAKAKFSVRVGQHFYGQAFLSLDKL